MRVFGEGLNFRPRVKICGLTRAEDVAACVLQAVDAIGFVFYSSSPRAISAAHAAALIRHIPATVKTVGLFVDASVDEVLSVLNVVKLDVLQFHGDESVAECQQVAKTAGLPWIKALPVDVRDIALLQSQLSTFAAAGAAALLLDAWHPTLKGGTGNVFDWGVWPQLAAEVSCPLILAGGLTPENVAAAVAQTRPYAVDVSGGVECVDVASGNPIKGMKDKEKIRQFMVGVQYGG